MEMTVHSVTNKKMENIYKKKKTLCVHIAFKVLLGLYIYKKSQSL